MGVYELFTCSQQCTHSVAFWLSILHVHFTSEAPILISTFISMLIFIILSFVDW